MTADQPPAKAILSESRCNLYRERIVQLLAQDIRNILIPLDECAALVDGVDEIAALRAKLAERDRLLRCALLNLESAKPGSFDNGVFADNGMSEGEVLTARLCEDIRAALEDTPRG